MHCIKLMAKRSRATIDIYASQICCWLSYKWTMRECDSMPLLSWWMACASAKYTFDLLVTQQRKLHLTPSSTSISVLLLMTTIPMNSSSVWKFHRNHKFETKINLSKRRTGSRLPAEIASQESSQLCNPIRHMRPISMQPNNHYQSRWPQRKQASFKYFVWKNHLPWKQCFSKPLLPKIQNT